MTLQAPAEPVSETYYRDMADAIRTLAPALKFKEARSELLLLAANYEWLADYLETHPSLTMAARLAWDSEWNSRRGGIGDPVRAASVTRSPKAAQ